MAPCEKRATLRHYPALTWARCAQMSRVRGPAARPGGPRWSASGPARSSRRPPRAAGRRRPGSPPGGPGTAPAGRSSCPPPVMTRYATRPQPTGPAGARMATSSTPSSSSRVRQQGEAAGQQPGVADGDRPGPPGQRRAAVQPHGELMPPPGQLGGPGRRVAEPAEPVFEQPWRRADHGGVQADAGHGRVRHAVRLGQVDPPLAGRGTPPRAPRSAAAAGRAPGRPGWPCPAARWPAAPCFQPVFADRAGARPVPGRNCGRCRRRPPRRPAAAPAATACRASPGLIAAGGLEELHGQAAGLRGRVAGPPEPGRVADPQPVDDDRGGWHGEAHARAGRRGGPAPRGSGPKRTALVGEGPQVR